MPHLVAAIGIVFLVGVVVVCLWLVHRGNKNGGNGPHGFA